MPLPWGQSVLNQAGSAGAPDTPTFLQVRDLIYREILEYHPHMLADYLQNGPRSGPGYMYPSAVRARLILSCDCAHSVTLTIGFAFGSNAVRSTP